MENYKTNNVSSETLSKSFKNYAQSNSFIDKEEIESSSTNTPLKQRLLIQKEQLSNNIFKNRDTDFNIPSHPNKSISSLQSNFEPGEPNNTSKKLRRFVKNRLFDVDLGKAKRSESPVKESEKEDNWKNSSFLLNNDSNAIKNLSYSQRHLDETNTQHLNRFASKSPIKLVKNINLKRSISAVHTSNREELSNEDDHQYHKLVVKAKETINIPPKQNSFKLENSNASGSLASIPLTNFVNVLPNEKVQVNGVLYKKIELIGKGGSSKVYKIKRLFKIEALEAMKQQGIHTSSTFALKRVDFDHFDESSISFFKGEIDILHKLQNKNRVVKLVDYEMQTDHINVVMECGSYSLSDVLTSRRNFDFDIEFVRYHFKEICLCLKDVHDADIIHSDLKPANFVFVKGVLKIIDFGIADSIPDNTVNIYREKQFGTPNYMAPEALVRLNNNDTNYTGSNFVFDYNSVENSNIYWKVGKPSDIWSLGCILYQMVYGDPPYGKFEGNKRLKAIMDPREMIEVPAIDKKGFLIPKSLTILINLCLEKASKKRPTIDMILYEDEFLNSISVSKDKLKEIVSTSLKKSSISRESFSNFKISDYSLDEIINEILNL